jgi:hypothetical protein
VVQSFVGISQILSHFSPFSLVSPKMKKRTRFWAFLAKTFVTNNQPESKGFTAVSARGHCLAPCPDSPAGLCYLGTGYHLTGESAAGAVLAGGGLLKQG